VKVVAQNRRARFDYEITDTVEAGMMLSGQEVKSCRLGQVSLAGAYVSFRSGNAIVKQMKISAYQPAGPQPDYDPLRDRELLLNRNERAKLEASVEEKGVTLLPLEVRSGKYVKLLLGLGKGRKTIDKRQAIKKKDIERELRKGKH
jgi:SsrA-binding protein